MRYSAQADGDGAIAQGHGATAVGAGGILVEGDAIIFTGVTADAAPATTVAELIALLAAPQAEPLPETNKVQDVLRLLMAEGLAAWQPPRRKITAQEWTLLRASLARAAVWPLACRTLPPGWAAALNELTAPGFAPLINDVRVALRNGTAEAIALQLQRRLMEDRYAEGVANLLADFADPQRGGAVLEVKRNVLAAPDAPAAPAAPAAPNTRTPLDLVKWLLAGAAGAAAGGIIGNRADDAFMALLDFVKKGLAQPARAASAAPPSAPLASPLWVPRLPFVRTLAQLAPNRALPAAIAGMPFCHVPAGNFLMGSSAADKDAHDDEKPQHIVYLSAYEIGQCPVTVAQFRAFVEARRYKTEAETGGGGWIWNNKDRWNKVSSANWQQPYGNGSDVRYKSDHPVTQVSWNDALAFCNWLGSMVGLHIQLPTEAQWEKAARGDDGWLWPWGNVFEKTKCNTYEGGKNDTTPVGAYGAFGKYGLMDAAGNVWNWCADGFDAAVYKNRARSVVSDPYLAPTADQMRVLRGGSWSNVHQDARAACRDRDSPDVRSSYCGFRVVCAPVLSPVASGPL
jgi:formylglycine-generating enzyme required for sulfatase activity